MKPFYWMIAGLAALAWLNGARAAEQASAIVEALPSSDPGAPYDWITDVWDHLSGIDLQLARPAPRNHVSAGVNANPSTVEMIGAHHWPL